jgi:hypothetical protein
VVQALVDCERREEKIYKKKKEVKSGGKVRHGKY